MSNENKDVHSSARKVKPVNLNYKGVDCFFAKCSKIHYTSRENSVVVSFVCWFIVTDTIKRYSEKKMMDNFVCGFTVTMNTTKRHVKRKSCIILFADLLYQWPLQNVTWRRSRVQFCLLIYCKIGHYKTSCESEVVDSFVCRPSANSEMKPQITNKGTEDCVCKSQ